MYCLKISITPIIPYFNEKSKETMRQIKSKIKIHILKQRITTGRKHLNDLWNVHGATNAIVLAASVELDELIVEYLKLQADVAEPQETKAASK